MYYHENELQYPVEVEEPDPMFARMLQGAIGGTPRRRALRRPPRMGE